jgi:hypothetical protein
MSIDGVGWRNDADEQHRASFAAGDRTGGADGRLELDDRDWGGGVNAGLLYDTGKGTRVGVT